MLAPTLNLQPAGKEGFELELGPWSTLGECALTGDDYVPDFDAVAIPPCRFLRIRRAAFAAACTSCLSDSVASSAVMSYQVTIVVSFKL